MAGIVADPEPEPEPEGATGMTGVVETDEDSPTGVDKVETKVLPEEMMVTQVVVVPPLGTGTGVVAGVDSLEVTSVVEVAGEVDEL